MQVPAKIYQLVLIKTVVVPETFQMAASRLCMCPGGRRRGGGGGGSRKDGRKRLCVAGRGGLPEKEMPPRAWFGQPRRRNEALEGAEEWKKMGGQRGEAVGDGAGMRERDANGH